MEGERPKGEPDEAWIARASDQHAFHMRGLRARLGDRRLNAERSAADADQSGIRTPHHDCLGRRPDCLRRRPDRRGPRRGRRDERSAGPLNATRRALTSDCPPVPRGRRSRPTRPRARRVTPAGRIALATRAAPGAARAGSRLEAGAERDMTASTRDATARGQGRSGKGAACRSAPDAGASRQEPRRRGLRQHRDGRSSGSGSTSARVPRQTGYGPLLIADRAAQDRANAALERARLEAALDHAHLDDLTGAFRREMGMLALTHEIDHARLGDGRFVIAFVDVDGMKCGQ